jgi:multiple sugar transport system substrate-binding protein
MMGNWLLGVPKASKNQQAAADFVKWMLQKDTQMTYAQNKGIPSRTSVLKDASLTDLCRAVREAYDQIHHSEVMRLRSDPGGPDVVAIEDALDALRELTREIKDEADE